MLALWIISLSVGAIWIALFSVNLAEHRATPRIAPRPPRRPQAPPSVLIPARDEAENIGPCLESLLAQEPALEEILVIDDRSCDATARIVADIAGRDARVRLLSAPEPPPGWTGKCHALHIGVTQGQPRGEWLLFTDADTRHHPRGVGAALDYASSESIDLLTLVPHLEARGFWERVVQPSVAALIALFNRPRRVNDPARPEVFANGQFMLVRRQAYLAAGGHAAVRGKVLEDVELARAITAAGFRMRLAIGRELFATRMYRSLRELVAGWTKNFHLILRSRPTRVVLAALASLALSIWPPLAALAAALALPDDPQPAVMAWTVIGIYPLVLALQTWLRAINRWYPAFAVLAPLGNVVAVFILLRSAWLHLLGRAVRWKGRAVFDERGEHR